MQCNQRKLTAAWWAVVSRFLLHGLILSTWISRIPALLSSLGLTHAEFGAHPAGNSTGIDVCRSRHGLAGSAPWQPARYNLEHAGTFCRARCTVLGYQC